MNMNFQCPSCKKINNSSAHKKKAGQSFFDSDGEIISKCLFCEETLYLKETWKCCLRPMTPDFKKERPILFGQKKDLNK